MNVSVAGALMMKELALDQIQMGRVFSAFLLGYALCQVPAGMLADRFGARRVLGIAALTWVFATALMVVAPAAAALPVLLGARFLLGIGEAPTFPAAAEAVSRHVPVAARGRANGFVIAAIGLGSAIAPPLVTAVMVRFGWRAALVVSVVPALAVACVWLAVKGMPPVVAGGGGAEAVAPATDRSLATRSFALLTASYTLQGYVGYIFVFWFYLYLVDVRKFDLLRGALYASLPWLLSIVSIPLGGAVSDALVKRLGPAWGRRLVPMAGLIGGAAFLSYGARTPDARVAAVCLALATALVLSVEGPFWAAMMDAAGDRSGTAGGVMNMGSNLGGLVSPALTPILAASIGWENALHVAAALSVVGGLLWLGVGPRASVP
ncbi:MAG: MFS transporter [Acidobacteria bacterium]|nr:MFS transporter [Acidobacteriota bacterium]